MKKLALLAVATLALGAGSNGVAWAEELDLPRGTEIPALIEEPAEGESRQEAEQQLPETKPTPDEETLNLDIDANQPEKVNLGSCSLSTCTWFCLDEWQPGMCTGGRRQADCCCGLFNCIAWDCVSQNFLCVQ